jgi:hypothetical protein
MPDPRDRTPTKETLRILANEQAGLALDDADLDALLPVVDALWDDVSRVSPSSSEGPEPGFAFEIEEWADD